MLHAPLRPMRKWLIMREEGDEKTLLEISAETVDWEDLT
jgi:hypothetical protein